MTKFGGYGITELRTYAREYDISGRSKMTGDELLAACHAVWDVERTAKEDSVLLQPWRQLTPADPTTALYGVQFFDGDSGGWATRELAAWRIGEDWTGEELIERQGAVLARLV